LFKIIAIKGNNEFIVYAEKIGGLENGATAQRRKGTMAKGRNGARA
jgi:hypothetical protein